jgi:hypothetical protein
MNLKELNKIDLSEYQEYLSEGMKVDFNKWAGYEHYRLLNYLCRGKKLVFDIGTYRGSSAIAMSSAKKVISYDVKNHRDCKKPSNVTFKLGDAMQDKNLLNADVILLDTFHDGEYENDFYDFIKGRFKGVLVIDDINVNAHMMRFWQRILEPKEEVTEIAHHSGTGIVYFGSNRPKRCSNCG